jgi:DNA topoisomerase-2
MSCHTEPEIDNYSGKDFVKVTFYPCFEKFNMDSGLDDEIVSLLTKRVYDMAGIMPRIKVSLN